MGKIPPTEVRDDISSLCVTTLLSLDLENLWKLDAIGVSDAEVEKKTQSLQAEMEEHFAHTTTRDIEGRYEVALPWVQDKERIPSNKDLAENQLRKNKDVVAQDTMSCYLPITSSILIPHLGSYLGSICVSEQDFVWYNKVYAPVWMALHTGMGYSSYLIWKECRGFNKESALPLALYGSTLALNWIWPPTFFTARSLKWAFVETALMAGTATGCVVTFSKINKTAGGLMSSYLVWITMATVLIYRLWRDNPPAIEAATEPSNDSKDKEADKKD
ncbi:TSPO [Cordylochernes scorpioides]|uniref:TSPO n=1 Tax=Cordylochernes scorpioides TaxID=51811 RepID=A0ABY6LJT7_9ARAC|nr:TSPO [Cordylochernes scorpioides]